MTILERGSEKGAPKGAKCARCGGLGLVIVPPKPRSAAYPDDSADRSSEPRAQLKPCPTCAGSGRCA